MQVEVLRICRYYGLFLEGHLAVLDGGVIVVERLSSDRSRAGVCRGLECGTRRFGLDMDCLWWYRLDLGLSFTVHRGSVIWLCEYGMRS